MREELAQCELFLHSCAVGLSANPISFALPDNG